MEKKIKLRIYVCIFLICSLFVFVSCGYSKSTKNVEKFLQEFKNKNITGSYTYLSNGGEFNKLKEYMDVIVNLQDVDDGLGDLANLILDKIFNFEYEILGFDEKNEYVEVKFKYFDFSNVYKEALNDFLTKSLDFENLDSLYEGNYIKNILVEHIENIPKKEINLKIKVSKNDGLKIEIDEEFLKALTGNFIEFFNTVNKNIIGN